MTDQELAKKCKAVSVALSDLTTTDKLRVIEKLGKKWRRQNSVLINEAVASYSVKMNGKRILDVDVDLHKK